ncbi:MAG: polysaccharide deacetylase family protein [Planctomycetota bacterium]|nr:MAG: polysaccharide deacetylase family protein [Planctomycetota bacterium]
MMWWSCGGAEASCVEPPRRTIQWSNLQRATVMTGTRFVTLMYHNVLPRPEWGPLSRSVTRYFVTPECFAEHMHVLVSRARCMTLSEVLGESTAASGAARPGAVGGGLPAVQLTFDDGWAGGFEYTAEVLRQHGWEATVFVTTGLIGHPLFVGEHALRSLKFGEFVIGAHSVSHAPLAELPGRRLREELSASKRRLEDLTGRPVVAMSVPGGSTDRRVREAAAECGYRVVYTSVPRCNVLKCKAGIPDGRPASDRAERPGSGRRTAPPEGDLQVFGRVAITCGTTAADVERFVRGGLLGARAAYAFRRGVRRLVGEELYAAIRTRLLGERPDGADMGDLLAESRCAERPRAAIGRSRGCGPETLSTGTAAGAAPGPVRSVANRMCAADRAVREVPR